MTLPKLYDDDQALRNLADTHRWNAYLHSTTPTDGTSDHLTVELTEVSQPETGTFSTAPEADAEFRRALTRGDFPVVPSSITTALTAPDRLRELAAAPRHVQRFGDLVMSTVEALLIGRPVNPQEFADDVLEAHRQAEIPPVLIRLHDTMRQQVRDAWPRVVSDALPVLLGGLRDPLTDVLTEARATYAALDGLQVDSSPVAVAAATDGQRKALLALDDLASRYDQLRNAQQAALAAASPDRLPGHRDRRRLSEPTTWAGVFDLGIHEFSEVRLRGAIGSAVTGTARLSQVVRRDDVWLPDRAQLDQAYNDLFPRTTANDGGGPDAA